VKQTSTESLSRRERQIMDLLYQLGEASAKDIQEGLPDPPSYSAVRAMLAILKEKGIVRHTKQERRYIYSPAVARPRAKRQALKRLLRTFFDDSPEKLVASLLDPDDQKLSDDEIHRIRGLIDSHEKKASK
jgi:predicted transcriptional regulator